MKKIAGIIGGIALMLCVSGCSWQMPEKVSVKTQAEYNFSLGNFEKDFSEELSVNKLLKDVELPNNGKIYDYWPNKKGNVQKYLMYMPLQEIPIDIGKYFNEGMLNELDSKPIIDQTIKVPSISIPEIKVDNIGFDSISEKLNEIFVLRGPSMTMPLNGNIQLILNELGRSFDSITYKKGTFVIESDLPDGITAWIESKGIPTSHAVFLNGKANIDITGFVINTDDLTIHFSEDYPTKVFKTYMSDNSEIKYVSGLNMAYDFNMPLSVNFDSVKQGLKESNIKECIIGEGSNLQVRFDIPWEGVTSNYSFKFEGGIEFSSGKYSPVNGKSDIPLTNAIITPNDINSTVTFELTFEDAEIDFDKKSSISVNAIIKKIASATVELPDLDIPPTFEQDIPDNIKNVVQEIIINDCGVVVDYINDFPKDNDITVNISSNFFDIENKTGTIFGDKSESFSLLSSKDPKTRNLTVYDKFDFTVNVTLPGGKPKEITVNDLNMNKDYHIKLSIKPVINWTKVTIRLSPDLFGDEGTGKLGTQFNPSSIFASLDEVMGTDFSKSIQFPDCKMYLYLTCPKSLQEMFDPNDEGLSGSSINLYYGDENNNRITATSNGTPIADNEVIQILKNTDSLKFKTKPVLIYDEGTEIITSQLDSSGSSLSVSLADLFRISEAAKEEGAQICIDYDLKLGATASTKEIYKVNLNDNEVSSIGIYAIIDLPLSFEMNGDTNIDLTKLMNKKDESSENAASSSTETEEKKDLFGRTEASGMDEIKQYIEAVKSVSLSYEPIAFPIDSTQEINIDIAFKENGTREVYKERFNIDTGRGDTLNLEVSKFEEMLDAYPLQLEANIYLKNGTKISIPREKKIDVNLGISLETDGEIPLLK